MYHYIKVLQILYYFVTVFLKSNTENVAFLVCCLENATKIVAILESATEIVALFTLGSINTYRKCSTFVCRIIECYNICITLWLSS